MSVSKSARLYYLQTHARGTQAARSGDEVAAFLGISHKKSAKRRIRDAVSEMRMDGVEVCSCKEGYFWPTTLEEFWNSYHYLTHDFAARRKAAEGLRRAGEREFGPEQLPLEEAS